MSVVESNASELSLKCLTEYDIQERVQSFRDLVSDDRILKKFQSDDGYLRRFLYCTNFNVAVAFKRLKAYYNLILENPEWFASTSPLEKKDRLEDNDKVILQGRDKCGRRVFVIKLGNTNIAETCPEIHSQLFDIYAESVIEEPRTVTSGLSIIIDMKGYSWKLFRWLTPTNIRIGAKKLDLCPVKEIILHIVNTSFLLNASIKLVWPFLNERIKKMVKFHFEDWPSLHEYMDPEILPCEYGGTGLDLDFEKSNHFLLNQSIEIEKRLKSRQLVPR